MFDNNNNGTPNTNDPDAALRQAMAARNLGTGGARIPEGTGVYSIDRVWTRMSRKNVPLFCARLKCESHENPAHVGRVFEWVTNLAGVDLNIILGTMTKFLILPFGEAAKKQMASPAADVAIMNAWKDGFKNVVETQTFAGQSLTGRQLRVTGIKGEPDEKGKQYVNAYFDCV